MKNEGANTAVCLLSLKRNLEVERRQLAMANLQREHQLKLRVSEEEYEIIQQKMKQFGTKNFSMYARKMLMNGYIIRHDYRQLKELTHELANLARSINQIAWRVNETRSIYKQDVEDLQRMYARVKRACTERLVKMLDEDL